MVRANFDMVLAALGEHDAREPEREIRFERGKVTGSIPIRTDTDLTAPGYNDQQREASRAMAEAAKSNRMVLSLAHNMAQTNQITAAMIDETLTAFTMRCRSPEPPSSGKRRRRKNRRST